MMSHFGDMKSAEAAFKGRYNVKGSRASEAVNDSKTQWFARPTTEYAVNKIAGLESRQRIRQLLEPKVAPVVEADISGVVQVRLTESAWMSFATDYLNNAVDDVVIMGSRGAATYEALYSSPQKLEKFAPKPPRLMIDAWPRVEKGDERVSVDVIATTQDGNSIQVEVKSTQVAREQAPETGMQSSFAELDSDFASGEFVASDKLVRIWVEGVNALRADSEVERINIPEDKTDRSLHKELEREVDTIISNYAKFKAYDLGGQSFKLTFGGRFFEPFEAMVADQLILPPRASVSFLDELKQLLVKQALNGALFRRRWGDLVIDDNGDLLLKLKKMKQRKLADYFK